MEQALDFLKLVMDSYVVTLPTWSIQVFTVMGSIRFVIKPIMSLIKVYTDSTPSKEDDKYIEKIKDNKIYKCLVYILDWSVSIKLPKKEK